MKGINVLVYDLKEALSTIMVKELKSYGNRLISLDLDSKNAISMFLSNSLLRKEKIKQYIHDFIQNPSCTKPDGIEEDVILNIQLFIDEYETEKRTEFTGTLEEEVENLLRQELTEEDLKEYHKKYSEYEMNVYHEKVEIRKELKKLLRQNDFSFVKAFQYFEKDLAMRDSIKTDAIISSIIDLLFDFFNHQILNKEDVLIVEKELAKWKNSFIYYPNFKALEGHVEFFKNTFEFYDTIASINASLQKVTRQYVKDVQSTVYSKRMDGITFVGANDKEVEELIRFYKEVKETSETVSAKEFITSLQYKSLFITTIAPPDILEIKATPCYIKGSPIIYLNHEALSGKYGGILFHEGEHFIDQFLNSKNSNNEIESILKSLRKSMTKEGIVKFLYDYRYELSKWQEVLIPYEKDIKEVLLGDLKNENKGFDKLTVEEQEEKLEGKYKKYLYHFANAKLFQNGYNAVFDIMDAVMKGKLKEWFPDYHVGHGSHFKKDDVCCGEILAEISTLYNIGSPELLITYFPYEEIKELIAIYEKSTQMGIIKEKLLENRKEIKKKVDSLLNNLGNKEPNLLIQASVITYEVAGLYLEEARIEYDEKYGDGSFIEALISYQMDDNIKIIKDENIRHYISLLSDGQIHMYLEGPLSEEKMNKNK